MSDTAEPVSPPAVRQRRGLLAAYLPFGLFVLVIALCVVAGAWAAYLAHRAESDLKVVRADVTTLRADVRNNDVTAVRADEKDLQAHAHAAYRDSRDPIWRIVAAIPDYGSDFKVAGTLADVTDNLAVKVLPPLADVTETLRPATLREPNGDINLAPLESAQATINAALPVLNDAQKRVAGLKQRVHVGQLANARTQFAQELDDVSTSLTTAATALNLLPPMLGADGPRHYLLVFQNLAEARGTGGLIGAYGVLQADHGKLTLPITGTDTDLENSPDLKPATVNLGPEFAARWMRDDPFRDWFLANLSPDFPSSAAILDSHYDQQFGTTIDGVIAIDPITLSELLGPDSVHLSDGSVVAGPDIPTFTESTLYTKYGQTNPIRKQLLIELAKDAFTQLEVAPGARLLTALQDTSAQGRLQVWSAHPAEESRLAPTPIGSMIPTGPGSFAWVAVNNEGPKTDFWLSRSLSYIAGACPAPGPEAARDSTIEVKLTDMVPPGQNAVVSKDMLDPSAPYGRGHSEVSIYGPVGAQLITATLNGQEVNVEEDTERGHAVYTIDDLFTPDGVTQDILLHLQEPVSTASYSWRPQPLAVPETVTDAVTPCN